MAATDARPVPRKNTAYRATFPILDNDGDLVTGAAGLDSEVDKDAAGFADCTNEATEIGSSGIYYLDLTSTEMNADTVTVIVKTSTTDAKTTTLIFYPEEVGDFRIDDTDLATAAALTTVDTVVDAIKAVTDNLPDSGALSSLATSAALATVDTNVDSILADTGTDGVVVAAGSKTGYSIGAGGISTSSFAAGAIDAAALAADAVDEILDETIGDSTITMRQALKLLVATLGGKLSGAATTTVTIRNAADDADVVSATVDADGNRTAVTLNL